MECLDCLAITKVPTMASSAKCLVKATVGGYKDALLIHCGIKMTTAVVGADPVNLFLAGTAMPLSPAAIVIALANGAPALTTTATIMDAVKWGLVGTFGTSLRGSMTQQESITHQGGSCEMPQIENSVWRMGIKQTRVGNAGNTPDYDMVQAFLANRKAYHVVLVECGETTGAVMLQSGEYTVSGYSFTRPEDGIKEFNERGIMFDYVSLLEPKSYGFPVYDDVLANFI